MPEPSLKISIDHLLEGVQVIGTDWIYRYINRTAAAQGEKTVAELLGANLFEAYPQIRDSPLHQHLAAVMERREQVRTLNEFLLPSGATRWFELLIEPVPDGVIVLSIDVTERQAAELERRQAVRLETLGQLAGGVAHDFNNLLTVILGYTEFLVDQAKSESMLADIQAISEAAQRAASMTRQLLTFSRGHAPQLASVSLGAVVRDVEPMLRRLLPENVQIRTTYGSGQMVTADKTELEQVLMNLAINARDAMPDGGLLSIETSDVSLQDGGAQQYPGFEPGDYVVLTVSDTGVGMPPAVQNRIFEPFFTTKDPGRGTGLGLAAVQRMVTQLKGHIHVYSEEGRGSVFKVYLCRTTTAASALSRPPAVFDSIPAPQRLLLVEDEANVREFVRRVLERAGYTVVSVSSGEEAIALLTQGGESFDILLTDLMLGGMSGFELAQAAMALRPEMKALFMSGYAEPIVGNAVADARVIEKPFTGRGLLTALQLLD